MTDFRAAFKKIRKSVVGIGIRNDPEYRIIGTGFITHPSGFILTNRHVLEGIADFLPNGEIKIKRGAAAFLFIQAPPTPEFRVVIGFATINIDLVAAPPNAADEVKELNEKIEKGEIIPLKFKDLDADQIVHPETLDIGVCKINPMYLPPEALPLSPVKIIHSRDVVEGTPIGVIGFPRGLSVPEKFASVSEIQMTPLLQVGVISGLLPVSGDPKPDRFVLDMIVNPGSSGSPLFLQNGNVVGIVHATRIAFHPLNVLEEGGTISESENSGVYVPSGLGLAIPSARFPEEWLESDKSKRKRKGK